MCIRDSTDHRVERLEEVVGHDGEYKIDVTSRFRVHGAELLVLIECKHLSRPVDRADVQVLHDKVRSVGAHKGMVFSTSGFRSGALTYAAAHGIALVHVVDGRSVYFARSVEPPRRYPPDLPRYTGFLSRVDDQGAPTRSTVGPGCPARNMFGLTAPNALL